ncbi:hypothetical protein AVEN_167525-1 [Araneus ventricosus]|uniref:Uncharacterized protein n=1 Tax=Araneus ventricosus TaxID=182803 RepID=A0A4Y2KFA0_ARAVE|nr:hypothetical protein AVEN_167525-1 [Araneus ventricosus]
MPYLIFCNSRTSEYYSVQNEQSKTRTELANTFQVSVVWWKDLGFRTGGFYDRNPIPPCLIYVAFMCAWRAPNLTSGSFVDVSRKFGEGMPAEALSSSSDYGSKV